MKHVGGEWWGFLGFDDCRAERVWIPGRGKIRPAAWMSLDGRRQGHANRNTRGYFNKQGKPVWLDVYEPLQ